MNRQQTPQRMTPHFQDRPPNFFADGRLFLVRCFACDPERGRENYAPAVAGGFCAWCGWNDPLRNEITEFLEANDDTK